jgi:hypothetical protein
MRMQATFAWRDWTRGEDEYPISTMVLLALVPEVAPPRNRTLARHTGMTR